MDISRIDFLAAERIAVLHREAATTRLSHLAGRPQRDGSVSVGARVRAMLAPVRRTLRGLAA
jgi:hypothetical protein